MTTRDAACSIDGCSTRVAARGWCHRHYRRWKRHGDPLGAAHRPAWEDRFWRRVPDGLSEDECWEWQGSRHRGGYGAFQVRGVVNYAHQAAYIIAHGELPAGGRLRHRCGNRPCVNARHLVKEETS